MTPLIFAAAVVVSLVLEYQRRRHTLEIRREYERLQWALPKSEPKIPLLESCLNVFMGLIMLTFGVLIAMTHLQLKPEITVSGWEKAVALFVASGIALSVVGGVAVWQNIRLRKG